MPTSYFVPRLCSIWQNGDGCTIHTQTTVQNLHKRLFKDKLLLTLYYILCHDLRMYFRDYVYIFFPFIIMVQNHYFILFLQLKLNTISCTRPFFLWNDDEHALLLVIPSSLGASSHLLQQLDASGRPSSSVLSQS